MVREKRRIAFFGGTFDPIHTGHLEMARAAAESLRLHQVYLVPAGQNPLKGGGPEVSDYHRLKMLRLAIAGEKAFNIWDGELGREGPSYTLDSVRHIERVYPNSHLFWIIGSDQVPLLPRWYGIGELVRKINFILVQRPGYDLVWNSIPGLTIYPVRNQLHDISATDIRDRLHNNRPVDNLLTPAVVEYIHLHGLYR